MSDKKYLIRMPRTSNDMIRDEELAFWLLFKNRLNPEVRESIPLLKVPVYALSSDIPQDGRVQDAYLKLIIEPFDESQVQTASDMKEFTHFVVASVDRHGVDAHYLCATFNEIFTDPNVEYANTCDFLTIMDKAVPLEPFNEQEVRESDVSSIVASGMKFFLAGNFPLSASFRSAKSLSEKYFIAKSDFEPGDSYFSGDTLSEAVGNALPAAEERLSDNAVAGLEYR